MSAIQKKRPTAITVIGGIFIAFAVLMIFSGPLPLFDIFGAIMGSMVALVWAVPLVVIIAFLRGEDDQGSGLLNLRKGYGIVTTRLCCVPRMP